MKLTKEFDTIVLGVITQDYVGHQELSCLKISDQPIFPFQIARNELISMLSEFNLDYFIEWDKLKNDMLYINAGIRYNFVYHRGVEAFGNLKLILKAIANQLVNRNEWIVELFTLYLKKRNVLATDFTYVFPDFRNEYDFFIDEVLETYEYTIFPEGQIHTWYQRDDIKIILNFNNISELYSFEWERMLTPMVL